MTTLKRCPTCHGAMRLVAFITQASVIDQILTHRCTRAAAGPASVSTRAVTLCDAPCRAG